MQQSSVFLLSLLLSSTMLKLLVPPATYADTLETPPCQGPYQGTALTQRDVNKILRLHQAWLKTITKGLTIDEPGQANFCGAILDSISFKSRDIRKVIFDAASLKQSDFSHSNGVGAHFIAADLSKANFQKANLSGSNMYLAWLKETNFANAELDGSILKNVWARSANFRMASLVGVQANDAQFNGSVLTKANLSNANLSDAKLKRVDLRDANLSNAIIKGADFYKADLSHAKLDLATADKSTRIERAIINGVDLDDIDRSIVNPTR